MDTNQQKVLNFHKTFGALINEKPTEISEEECQLRLRLITEELNELATAMGFETYCDLGSDTGVIALEIFEKIQPADLPAIADATGDLKYVVYGTDVACGIDGESVFNEIHRSNMSKANIDGSINRREDGKIIKSSSYSPARIKEIIHLQQNKCCENCENCNKAFSGVQQAPYTCKRYMYFSVTPDNCCKWWKLDAKLLGNQGE